MIRSNDGLERHKIKSQRGQRLTATEKSLSPFCRHDQISLQPAMAFSARIGRSSLMRRLRTA